MRAITLLALLFPLPLAAGATPADLFHLPVAGAESARVESYRVELTATEGRDVLAALSREVVEGEVGRDAALRTESCRAGWCWPGHAVPGTIETGIVVNAQVSPAEDGRLVLAFEVERSFRDDPVRQRDSRPAGTEPAQPVDLPAIHRYRASGRTLVRPGVETAIADLPGAAGEAISFTARVTPLGPAEVSIPGDGIHGPPFDLPPPCPEPEVFEAALVLEPARETLARFATYAAMESGLRFEAVLETSLLADFDVEVAQDCFIADPNCGVFKSGFTAEVADGALRFNYRSLIALTDFSTTLGAFTAPVTIEIPESATHRGAVPLVRGRAAAVVADLADGGRLDLFVARSAR